VLSMGDIDENAPFEVVGINVTLLGRTTFLPICHIGAIERDILPKPASIYPYTFIKKKEQDPEKQNIAPTFETCPCQPRMQLQWARTRAPLESENAIQIRLADGELFTVPAIRLKNYAGPSAQGGVQRLQIIAVDLPSLSDKPIYDTEDGEHKELSEEEFTRDLIERANPPPLKVRVLAPSLILDGVNNGLSADPSNTISIQIGAAHNAKQQLKKETTIRIRFRYRGLSTASTDLWRKREMSFIISCIEGPRVSSMDFRPDLTTGSCFVIMCNSLVQGKPDDLHQAPPPLIEAESEDDSDSVASLEVTRVGMDGGFHVANNEAVFVLTIANETTSQVTLSRDGGIGGLLNSPLPSMRVHSGVSAKFPVVISRIPRFDSDGKPVDVVEEVIARTSFTWETERQGDPSGSDMAKGYLRIPREPLEDIIGHHPNFVSQVCEPPCQIAVTVGGKDASLPTLIEIGQAVTIDAFATEASWLLDEGKKSCSLKIEVHCARKNKPLPGGNVAPRDFVWCGKLRETFLMSDPDKKHCARIAFLNSGVYAVSACARIKHKDSEQEEIWWAPVAATVTVSCSAQ
jgi:hypothetical protein